MEQNAKYGEAAYLTDEQLDLLIKHLPEGPHRVAILCHAEVSLQDF